MRIVQIALAVAGLTLVCCAGFEALGQSLPTQSTNIPLQYLFDSGTNQPRLAINIGINGGPSLPYLFDTGSTLFNAAYNPNTWNNFTGPIVASNIQLCYSGSSSVPGGCRGYTGNIVQVPTLSFYAPGATAPAATFTASPGFQINAASSYTDVNGITVDFPGYFSTSSVPPQEGLFYGVFGARDSVDLLNKGCAPRDCYTAGGVLGQAIVSGVTSQGYIVAANGQPNPTNFPFPVFPINPPSGGQIVSIGGQLQAVTSCSPCVTVGLTPQLIGQFAAVGPPGQNPALQALVPWIPPTSSNPAPPFPNPYGGTTGNNSAPTDGANFTVTVTPNGGSGVQQTVPGLLDTGTRDFNLASGYPTPTTGTVEIVGATPNRDSITGLPISTSTLTGGVAYSVASDGSTSTIGIPFFMQNSVMFDLTDQAIGYTPFFVTDASLVTTANGPLIVDSSNVPLGLAGVISGPGGVIINAGGAIQTSATNTYTGITSIAAAAGGTPAGILLVSGPGSIASSAGVVNNGVFDISRAWQSVSIQSLSGNGQVYLGGQNLNITNGSGTFAGAISDGGSVYGYPGVAGSLTISGGTQVLSGASNYTGVTTVMGGQLVLNGSVTSDVFVIGGGLSGTGTIFGKLGNAGIVAPGAPGSTLTVTDAYMHSTIGVLVAQVNASGQSSQLAITRAANLRGGTVLAVATPGTYGARTTYNILTAGGGVTGAFSSVVSSTPFLIPSLSYDANNVYLTLQAGNFALAAQNPTQSAVAAALDIGAANAGGDFSSVIGALAQLPPSQVAQVLTALSGQNYSGFASGMVQGAQLFLNNFSTQAGGGSGNGSSRVALAQACDVACDTTETGKWGAWGGGVGGFGTVGSGSSAGAMTYSLGGFAAGLDRQVTEKLRVGVTTGYTSGTQSTQGFQGSGQSNTVLAGIYGDYSVGAAYADLLVGYAYSDNQMVRTISFPGVQRTAHGQVGANQFLGQMESGYRFELGGPSESSVTPFGRLQVYTANEGTFSEWGAQSLNLTVQGQSTTSVRSVLGAQFGSQVEVGLRDSLGLQFRLGWSHEYADTSRPVTAALAGAPTAPFTTYGATAQRDGLLLGLSANTAVVEATSVYLRYEGIVSGQDNVHAVTAGVRMTW